MSVTPETFRQQFEAFADPNTYKDLDIETYASIALMFMNADRWGTALDYGTSLFIAHHLVLQTRDIAAVAAGGIPGGVQGVLTAKSVDKVAASYDVKSVTIENGDFWNMTTFGIRFLHYARMMGAGPIQIGGRGGPFGPWLGFSGQ